MALAPGSTIGILGGGQLGRMMALAAARLGYQCHILDPHEHPCAAEVSAHFTRAAFDDEEALRRFADQCEVVTYEFENIPAGPLVALRDKLVPGTTSLEVAQDRANEKRFLEDCGIRIAPWREVNSEQDIESAILRHFQAARSGHQLGAEHRQRSHGDILELVGDDVAF